MSPIIKAALWMAGWLACMVVMAVAGRETTRELDVFQAMLMRSLIGLVMLYPLIHLNGGLRTMHTEHPLRHLARNVAHFGAQFSWLMALNLIPLAQVVSSGSPCRSGQRSWRSLSSRTDGAVEVAGRGGGPRRRRHHRAAFQRLDQSRPADCLCASLGFATSVIFVKALTRHDKPTVIMFWMMAIQSAIGLVPACWSGVAIGPSAVAAGVLVRRPTRYCSGDDPCRCHGGVPMDFLPCAARRADGLKAGLQRKVDAYVAAGAALILAGNLLSLKGKGPFPSAQGNAELGTSSTSASASLSLVSP